MMFQGWWSAQIPLAIYDIVTVFFSASRQSTQTDTYIQTIVSKYKGLIAQLKVVTIGEVPTNRYQIRQAAVYDCWDPINLASYYKTLI